MAKYNVNFEGLRYEGFGLVVALDTLPHNILIALAQRGLDNKIRDAGALTKEEKEAMGPDVEAHIAARRAAVIDTLTRGEWSQKSSGPRLKGIDAVMDEVAEQALKVAYASVKRAWPTGKGSAETIRGMKDKYLAKYGQEVRLEAQDRMAKAASRPAVNLDDLI